MSAKDDKKTDDKKNKDGAVDVPSPEEQLAALQKKVKLSQILIIASAAISLGFGAGALVWAAVTASRIKNLEPEPASAINDRIDHVEKRLSTMFVKQDELQFKVEASYTALEDIRKQREERDYGAIQKILIEQRTDYNDMLAILNTGVLALANMMRGSREWIANYTRRIEEAIELNRKRIEVIYDLPKQQDAAASKPPVAPPVKPSTPGTGKPSADNPSVDNPSVDKP